MRERPREREEERKREEASSVENRMHTFAPCTDERPPPLPLIIEVPRGWVGGWVAGRRDLLSLQQQYVRGSSSIHLPCQCGYAPRAPWESSSSPPDHFETIRANRLERPRMGCQSARARSLHRGNLSVPLRGREKHARSPSLTVQCISIGAYN